MHRSHRDWSRLSWSLWIILLGLAAAVACGSHPPTHDHDVGHPPLCTDTSSPATLGNDKPLLFPDGGTFPLFPKSSFPIASLVALSAQLLVGLLVLPEAVSQRDACMSVSPPIFLVALRR
jgi:hypothetical protein